VASGAYSLSERLSASLAAINELDGSIKEVEANALQSSQISETVAKYITQEAKTSVAKSVEGIDRIKEIVLQSSQTIKNLGSRTENIGEIVNVIADITRETNLLALNASIIASQAGERGRGFNIVADSIRELSERTAISTTEIANLIELVQAETKKAVTVMEQGSRSVEEGVKLITEVVKTLNLAVGDSVTAFESSKKIAGATAEQAKNIKQISYTETGISRLSEEIAKATKEQTLGSEQMSKAVVAIREMSQQFKRATTEQSQGAKLITRASQETTELAQNILKAVQSEAQESDTMVQALERMRSATRDNLEVVSHLNEMAQNMKEQADLLREEISRFRI
jgi:methyl-accepting chemotaxis protein